MSSFDEDLRGTTRWVWTTCLLLTIVLSLLLNWDYIVRFFLWLS